MKRPYIPLSVRVQVAEMAFFKAGPKAKDAYFDLSRKWTLKHRLIWLRDVLFPYVVAELDHDPALVLRKFNKRTGKYIPDANDPRYLVYRKKAEHQQKTTGRKPGATHTATTKGSDIGLKTKFARLETKKKRKPRHIARPKGFPKGRTISSRPFPRRKSRKIAR